MARPKVKRGDVLPGVEIVCLNGSVPVDLTEAASIRLIGVLGGTKIIDRAVTGTDQGVIAIDAWQTADTEDPGELLLEVEVTWTNGAKQTFPSGGYLTVEIVPDLG